MGEAAKFDLSRRRGPGIIDGIIDTLESYRQSRFGFGHSRTGLGSGLHSVALRWLSRKNAGRKMTTLHHALCGNDFDYTPVSIIMFKVFFWFLGAMQHRWEESFSRICSFLLHYSISSIVQQYMCSSTINGVVQHPSTCGRTRCEQYVTPELQREAVVPLPEGLPSIIPVWHGGFRLCEAISPAL